MKPPKFHVNTLQEDQEKQLFKDSACETLAKTLMFESSVPEVSDALQPTLDKCWENLKKKGVVGHRERGLLSQLRDFAHTFDPTTKVRFNGKFIRACIDALQDKELTSKDDTIYSRNVWYKYRKLVSKLRREDLSEVHSILGQLTDIKKDVSICILYKNILLYIIQTDTFSDDELLLTLLNIQIRPTSIEGYYVNVSSTARYTGMGYRDIRNLLNRLDLSPEPTQYYRTDCVLLRHPLERPRIVSSNSPLLKTPGYIKCWIPTNIWRIPDKWLKFFNLCEDVLPIKEVPPKTFLSTDEDVDIEALTRALEDIK